MKNRVVLAIALFCIVRLARLRIYMCVFIILMLMLILHVSTILNKYFSIKSSKINCLCYFISRPWM